MEVESLRETAQKHLAISALDNHIAALSQPPDYLPCHLNVVIPGGRERGMARLRMPPKGI